MATNGIPEAPQVQPAGPMCIQLPQLFQQLTLKKFLTTLVIGCLVSLGPFIFYGILCTIALLFRHTTIFAWLWVTGIVISFAFSDLVDSIPASLSQYTQELLPFDTASVILNLTRSIEVVREVSRQFAPAAQEENAERPDSPVTIEEVGGDGETE